MATTNVTVTFDRTTDSSGNVTSMTIGTTSTSSNAVLQEVTDFEPVYNDSNSSVRKDDSSV